LGKSENDLRLERALSGAAAWPSWTNQPIVLYHGTIRRSAESIVRHGVDVVCGDPNVDFGLGFYTTTSLSQARKWAIVIGSVGAEPHAIVQLTLDRNALGSLRTLAFVRGETDAVDFWSFVAHCRRGLRGVSEADSSYDVVYGPVARSWWGPERSSVHRRYDQVSFHGSKAQGLLRDAGLSRIEVIE
jgi:uncharacterized protein DUF3990